MNTDEYVKKLESPVKEIVVELRAIVTGYSASLKETIKWNVPTYSINSNICSIMAHQNHVNLQIFHGAHIVDAGKLAGTGKDMRHLKFVAKEDISTALIKSILSQAIELDEH